MKLKDCDHIFEYRFWEREKKHTFLTESEGITISFNVRNGWAEFRHWKREYKEGRVVSESAGVFYRTDCPFCPKCGKRLLSKPSTGK